MARRQACSLVRIGPVLAPRCVGTATRSTWHGRTRSDGDSIAGTAAEAKWKAPKHRVIGIEQDRGVVVGHLDGVWLSALVVRVPNSRSVRVDLMVS
jgi:hypothetical protein